MRLLQAMAGGTAGGAEAFFVRLALAFKRAGLEQRLVMRPNRPRQDALAAARLAPVVAPFGGRLDLATPRVLGREIAAFRPDIVLAWMSRASRAAGRVRTAPGVVRIGRLGGYYALKYYAGCDHLIGNTPAIVDYVVREGWPEGRAHFLPNFVDAAGAAPVDRAALATPADAAVVLALGRLHHGKAFDVLLRALPEVPRAHLWLAGEGALRGVLEELARRLGVADRVRFLGWRDDAAALMAAADALVCPSRVEPFGNVIVEAWAHGLPVVAAAAAGPAWLIAHEQTGLLVAREDSAELAAALRRVFADQALAERLGAAGRQAYAERFSERVVVARYLGLFERVLGTCAASPA
jgi:glycosyltransferase involved in cell wall biosynthesis